MKRFFKKITHDPYIDWAIIVTLLTTVILLLAIWSYIYYLHVNRSLSNTDTVVDPLDLKIDIKALETLVGKFEDKIQDVSSPNMPVIDVRDPSL